MSYSPEDAFRIVLSCLGWGDPLGGLWFVGIEEGSSFAVGNEDRLDTELRRYRRRFAEDDGSEPEGPISVCVSKIAASLSVSHAEAHPADPFRAWAAYRKHRLWRKGSEVGHLNLYPLGKRRPGDWPETYFARFGFAADERDRYVNLVRTERFLLIDQAMSENKPQAVVCFGKSYWQEFRIAFRVSDRERAALPPAPDVEVYEGHKSPIVLTRHFANGMKDQTLQVIVGVLREYGVKLP